MMENKMLSSLSSISTSPRRSRRTTTTKTLLLSRATTSRRTTTSQLTSRTRAASSSRHPHARRSIKTSPSRHQYYLVVAGLLFSGDVLCRVVSSRSEDDWLDVENWSNVDKSRFSSAVASALREAAASDYSDRPNAESATVGTSTEIIGLMKHPSISKTQSQPKHSRTTSLALLQQPTQSGLANPSAAFGVYTPTGGRAGIGASQNALRTADGRRIPLQGVDNGVPYGNVLSPQGPNAANEADGLPIGAPTYYRVESGATCPEGSFLSTEDECDFAARRLGVNRAAGGVLRVDAIRSPELLPRGCILHVAEGVLAWNTLGTAVGSAAAYAGVIHSICKTRSIGEVTTLMDRNNEYGKTILPHMVFGHLILSCPDRNQILDSPNQIVALRMAMKSFLVRAIVSENTFGESPPDAGLWAPERLKVEILLQDNRKNTANFSVDGKRLATPPDAPARLGVSAGLTPRQSGDVRPALAGEEVQENAKANSLTFGKFFDASGNGNGQPPPIFSSGSSPSLFLQTSSAVFNQGNSGDLQTSSAVPQNDSEDANEAKISELLRAQQQTLREIATTLHAAKERKRLAQGVVLAGLADPSDANIDQQEAGKKSTKSRRTRGVVQLANDHPNTTTGTKNKKVAVVSPSPEDSARTSSTSSSSLFSSEKNASLTSTSFSSEKKPPGSSISASLSREQDRHDYADQDRSSLKKRSEHFRQGIVKGGHGIETPLLNLVQQRTRTRGKLPVQCERTPDRCLILSFAIATSNRDQGETYGRRLANVAMTYDFNVREGLASALRQNSILPPEQFALLTFDAQVVDTNAVYPSRPDADSRLPGSADLASSFMGDSYQGSSSQDASLVERGRGKSGIAFHTPVIALSGGDGLTNSMVQMGSPQSIVRPIGAGFPTDDAFGSLVAAENMKELSSKRGSASSTLSSGTEGAADQFIAPDASRNMLGGELPELSPLDYVGARMQGSKGWGSSDSYAEAGKNRGRRKKLSRTQIALMEHRRQRTDDLIHAKETAGAGGPHSLLAVGERKSGESAERRALLNMLYGEDLAELVHLHQ
ncbi:unnamed protein product [Amoebophrya sp. A25]|nr:unnamed protein product [Amoebophrya sp. A25]|eukprot:GSA25T00023441001.1